MEVTRRPSWGDRGEEPVADLGEASVVAEVGDDLAPELLELGLRLTASKEPLVEGPRVALSPEPEAGRLSRLEDPPGPGEPLGCPDGDGLDGVSHLGRLPAVERPAVAPRRDGGEGHSPDEAERLEEESGGLDLVRVRAIIGRAI